MLPSFEDLELHYQPQVTSDGTRIVAVEALLRVRRPRPNLMGTADALAAFARAGGSEALDFWVFERACHEATLWPDLRFSVNLSTDRFRDGNLHKQLTEIARRAGVRPDRIELEILESAYLRDFDAAVATISALRAEGFRIALDDFGTGYSSLGYLLKLPVDKIKIDKSFIADIGSMKSATIVHAIIAMARALGLKITAEGVETEDQWRFLKAAGCHCLQGWLFSKAVPAETIARMIEDRIDLRPAQQMGEIEASISAGI